MLKISKLQISWTRFYGQCKADIKLWCYFVLFQQLGRLYFIYSLRAYLAPTSRLSTILYSMVHGLRFDSLWATCWLFIPLIFFTIPSLFLNLSDSNKSPINLTQRYRRYLGGIFTGVTAIIYIANIEYFREYRNIFNQFLFDWFYDDKIAVLKTIYVEHHVISYFILVVIVLLLYFKYSYYFIGRREVKKSLHYSHIHKVILSLAIVLFYIVGFRGSVGPRPIQQKDAGVTQDAFLNKAIISPYSALLYAIDEYKYNRNMDCNSTGLSAAQAQVTAKKFFSTDQQYDSLKKYMEKTARGSVWSKPRHIFLIVGESLSTWPLQHEYRQFDLMPNLKKIVGNGIYFERFLACSYNTIATLNTIMTGLHDADLHINYQKSSYNPYSTSIATQLQKLGFRSQFFYGGYLSWQRLEDFAYAQGFTAIYGASHISNWRQTNEWGVDDRTLFEFVTTVIKNSTTNTFNIIMTTSNHPPFSINLEQEHFPKEKVTELLAKYPVAGINAKELGHIWYADKTIGEFIKKMGKLEPTALFIITGDHFARRHILTNPPLFDTAAVPLIIYSDKIKEYCMQHDCKKYYQTAGSHLDLAATIIELIAPQGFTYYTMGDDLLTRRKFDVGIGRDRIITKDYIAAVNTSDIMWFNNAKTSCKSQKLPPPTQLGAFRERFKQITYLARYLIKKGDILYEPELPTKKQ